jgi:hypothetical protein
VFDIRQTLRANDVPVPEQERIGGNRIEIGEACFDEELRSVAVAGKQDLR